MVVSQRLYGAKRSGVRGHTWQTVATHRIKRSGNGPEKVINRESRLFEDGGSKKCGDIRKKRCRKGVWRSRSWVKVRFG